LIGRRYETRMSLRSEGSAVIIVAIWLLLAALAIVLAM